MRGGRLSLYSHSASRGKPVLAPLGNFALNPRLIALRRCGRIATLLQNRRRTSDSKLANRQQETYHYCKIANLSASGPAKVMFRVEVVWCSPTRMRRQEV
jgi:hypothetical protein